MSLDGLTVAVTGSRRARELFRLIENFGGTPYLAPTVGIAAQPEARREAEAFLREIIRGETDYAVFMTGPGVYSLLAAARELAMEADFRRALERVTIVARSAKPRRALAEHGIRTDVVPEENTAEGIAKTLIRRRIAGKKVAVLWHGGYVPEWKEVLEAAGARVFESSTYRYSTELDSSGARILEDMGFDYVAPDPVRVTQLIEDLIAGRVDAVTFTSPPAVRNLFTASRRHNQLEALRESLQKRAIVVAVGPPTRKALEEEKVRADVMPDVYRMGPMVRALVDYLSRPVRLKGKGRGVGHLPAGDLAEP